jgi:hypothetical protein
VFVALAVSTASPVRPVEEPSMVERLKKVAREADPEVNIFLNERRVELFQERVRAEQDPVETMILRSHLAFELLYAGRPAAALEQAQEILRIAGIWSVPEQAPVMRSLHELVAWAYLRLGEQENCIARHAPESCLMPIRGAGVHTVQRGSRAAIGELEALLERDPGDLGYRWLLNLAYMTLGEHPAGVPSRWLIPPEAFASEHALQPFPDVAPALGIDASGLAGGSIVEDLDGDGYLDIVASSWGLEDQLRFFHNEADGAFSEWTERAGMIGQVGGLNLLHADYDNDGDADILVLRGGWLGFLGPGEGDHPNSLLRNDGNGAFTDVSAESGLLGPHPTQTAAWADFDLDGRLDLFVGNESVPGDRHPCQLFRNDGDGSFEDVAAEVGLDHVGFVKGVSWGDYDNDGWPDLYLSEFGGPNHLYRNGGSGAAAVRFTDVTGQAGVAEPALSFPAWFWDYDNDGWQDLFVASFSSYAENTLGAVVADYLKLGKAEHSRLYRNRGDGTFDDVTRETHFDAVLMAMGANFGDIDNDGFLDAYFGTGQPSMMTLVPNRMFRNAGGRVFQDVTTSGGFGHLQKGHGISFADLDNDGDQDIYAVFGGAYSGDSFRNALFLNPGTPHHWLTLELVGVASNRSAIGARVNVTVPTERGERHIHRTLTSGGSFGASPLRLEIGLGRAREVSSVEITWPNRRRSSQTITGIDFDRVLRVVEGEVGVSVVPLKRLDLAPPATPRP